MWKLNTASEGNWMLFGKYRTFALYLRRCVDQSLKMYKLVEWKRVNMLMGIYCMLFIISSFDGACSTAELAFPHLLLGTHPADVMKKWCYLLSFMIILSASRIQCTALWNLWFTCRKQANSQFQTLLLLCVSLKQSDYCDDKASIFKETFF